MLRQVGPVILAALGALAVSSALPEVDRTREARAVDDALLFVPDGRTMRMASTGQAEPLSDLLWIRAVLIFGERYGQDASTRWTEWLRAMIVSVTDLDPGWRTPYFWGGIILRVSDDLDGSDLVFTRGTDAFPQDFFFPMSLAMNAWLYRHDGEQAASWAERAANLPNAPKWYHNAAVAMRARSGDREAAIHYLQETLKSTNNEAIRSATAYQLGKLLHDRLVDTWADACVAWKIEHGAPLARPEDLARLGYTLPENPRGDRWVVGRDGVVRSGRAEKERLRDLRGEEFKILK